MLVQTNRIVRCAVLGVGSPCEKTKRLARPREDIGRQVRSNLLPATLPARLAGPLQQLWLKDHRPVQHLSETAISAEQQVLPDRRLAAGDAHRVILRTGLAERDEHLADRARTEAKRDGVEVRFGILRKRTMASRRKDFDDLLGCEPPQQIDEMTARIDERRRVVPLAPPITSVYTPAVAIGSV